MTKKIIVWLHYPLHLIIYNGAWIICILTASQRYAYIGPLLTILFASILFCWQACIVKKAKGLVKLILYFWFVGLIGDTALSYLNVITFPQTVYVLTPISHPIAPLFMQSLWIIFSITFYGTLSFMMTRYLLVSLFAFIGFPAAYWLGSVFHAADLNLGYLSLILIGLVYAILLPISLIYYNRG